jgi:hypothetical protein
MGCYENVQLRSMKRASNTWEQLVNLTERMKIKLVSTMVSKPFHASSSVLSQGRFLPDYGG